MYLHPLKALCAACLFTLLFAGGDAAAQTDESSNSFAGTWTGSLEVPGGALRIVFGITHDAETGYASTMASPDQGAFDIPVDSVVADSASVTISVAAIGGEYSGTLSDDGNAIAGTWTQSGLSFDLDLVRTEETIDPNRPQDPEPPFPYTTEDVTFGSAVEGVTLAGTLSVPSEGAPSHAVVLISGSGAQDRNSAIFGHRPFLVLADYLTRKGIAVLRFDDRGIGASTGDFKGATTKDFADDVRGALDFLTNHPSVADANIGLIGHSEGGLVAPMVAAGTGDVDLVVLIAAPGVPGDELLLTQSRALAKFAMRAQRGLTDEETLEQELDKILSTQELIFEAVKTEADNEVLAASLRPLIDEQLVRTGQLNDEAARSQVVDTEIATLTSPWLRYFMTYDPRPTLSDMSVPVLVVGGSKDMQVDSKINLPAVEAALKAGGNADVTILELDGLNHLLQTAGTGHITEYGSIAETMAPRAMETIATWILER